MKLRLNSVSTRLFLAIFATCLLLVLIMHQGVRMSFQHGFIDYIKENDQQRVELVSSALAEQYEEMGNWRFLIGNDRIFFRILRSVEHQQHRGPMRQRWRTFFWVYDTQDRLIFGQDTPCRVKFFVNLLLLAMAIPSAGSLPVMKQELAAPLTAVLIPSKCIPVGSSLGYLCLWL